MDKNKRVISEEFILSVVLAVAYGIFTLILIIKKSVGYFVFGNIAGLTIIIYQLYLLLRKPRKERRAFRGLTYLLKKDFDRIVKGYRDHFEILHEFVIYLFKRIKPERKKRLVEAIPSKKRIEKIPRKREVNKAIVIIFYITLGLFIFNITLYFGLSLDKDVFVYGFLGLVFTSLIIILILYFVYRIIKRLLFGRRW